jgi:digeranylgeranylglycerophospholipid reductase
LHIAIIGGGLAGLACAHELERLGVTPEIYEQGDQVGTRSCVVETMAQFMHHQPRQDIYTYLQEDLGLPLHPNSHINRIVLHSRGETATLTGHLAYTTIRGQDDRSLERQLVRQLRSPIHYHLQPDVVDLSRRHDWVVVANGDDHFTRQFHQFTPHIAWWLHGAAVEGDFTPSEEQYFFNTRYAGTGYTMLTAYDERTASIGVAVPTMPGAACPQLSDCFRAFCEAEGHRWGQVRQEFQFGPIECGHVQSHVLGNVILTGHAGGFVDSLTIAGQCASMTSGVLAARQIALQDGSFDRFVAGWHTQYDRLWRVRRSVNAWTDRDFDRMVALAGAPGASLLANSPWNLLEPTGMLLDTLGAADDLSPDVGPG